MMEKIFTDLKSNKKMYCGLATIFIMTFIIGCLTPYHSDDFSYYFQGIDFVKHYNHYMGWSGRLAADWTSGALLVTKCHTFIVGVQALVLATYCYMIASMPARVLNKTMSWYMPVLIFIAYWICNVNLGQTTFWIVGSANYLFTNFYIICFLTYYYNHYSETDWLTMVKGFLLAIIAGCTNENTSVMLICVMIASIVLLKWQKDDFQLKPAMVYLAGVVIGTLLLLLAPGNYKRANHPAFAKWKALNWVGKIKAHARRFPGYTKDFLPIFLVLVMEYLVIKLSNNFKKNTIAIWWSGIFILATIGSLIVMAAAPGMAPRTYNGPLTFLLVALSFTMYFECDNLQLKLFSLCQIIIYFVCLFVPSYVYVFASYKVALVQNALRKETIEYNKLNAKDSFSVPGYYFPKLRKWRDMYDMFHSDSMAQYYGVKHIDKVDVDFDYSLLKTGKLANKDFSNIQTKKFDIYTMDRGLILRRGRVLVTTRDENLIQTEKVLILTKKETGKCYEYKLPPFVKIIDKYCSGVEIDSRFRADRYNFELR